MASKKPHGMNRSTLLIASARDPRHGRSHKPRNRAATRSLEAEKSNGSIVA
jgi:hypothetical protein